MTDYFSQRKMLGMKLTVRKVIDTIGFPEAARLSGMSRTAVRNWHKNNKLPHWQEDRFAPLAYAARQALAKQSSK